MFLDDLTRSKSNCAKKRQFYTQTRNENQSPQLTFSLIGRHGTEPPPLEVSQQTSLGVESRLGGVF